MILNLKAKLIALGLVVLLPIGGYYSGKFVESNACQAKATVRQLTSEIKGKERQDEIAKDARRLSDAERDAARAHWMR